VTHLTALPEGSQEAEKNGKEMVESILNLLVLPGFP
jgi:hypothetical protein